MKHIPNALETYIIEFFSECNLAEKIIERIKELPYRLSRDLGKDPDFWETKLMEKYQRIIIDYTLDYIYNLADRNAKKYNKDISRKAEIARKMTEIEIKKQIERSLKDSYFTLAGTGTVYLGTDTTFYDASHGDSGTSSTGACPFFYGSDYYITANKAEAATVLGPGGYCSKGAWAWIGKSFYVSGSGSQTANIIQRGHIWGLTSAAAGGSSHAEIKFVVKDLTTGAEYSTTIYSKSEGGVGWTEVNRDYTKGITVNLQAGHTYIAYLLVETSGAIYGIGEAGSDFGRQDGDYVGEGAWYYSITIDF